MRKLLIALMLLTGCSGVSFNPDGQKVHFFWPVSGIVFQGFYGDKISGIAPGTYYDEHDQYQFFPGLAHMHRAIDIDNALDTQVFSAEAGLAHRYDWDQKNDYGNRVVIDHQNGYFTLYAHLNLIVVPDGKHVSKGEFIGNLGTTGNSTGPHLHFEIRHSSNGNGLEGPHFIPGAAGDRVLQGSMVPYDYPAVKN